MRTKLVTAFLVAAMMFGVTGCAANKAENNVENGAPSRFVMIEQGGVWSVCYDKYTRVMYAVSQGSYNHGNFSPLYNADGSLLLYKED